MDTTLLFVLGYDVSQLINYSNTQIQASVCVAQNAVKIKASNHG